MLNKYSLPLSYIAFPIPLNIETKQYTPDMIHVLCWNDRLSSSKEELNNQLIQPSKFHYGPSILLEQLTVL